MCGVPGLVRACVRVGVCMGARVRCFASGPHPPSFLVFGEESALKKEPLHVAPGSLYAVS